MDLIFILADMIIAKNFHDLPNSFEMKMDVKTSFCCIAHITELA
jgi:hypothetical protein